LWPAFAFLLLALALPAPAADRDAFGDPLPDGAVARLGSVRAGPTDVFRDTRLLPPRCDTFLVVSKRGLHRHELATGKTTDLAAPESSNHRSIVAVSANGTRAVILESDTYTVVDAATGKSVLPAQKAARGYDLLVSLSADGKLFAYPPARADREPPKAVVRNVDTGAEVAQFKVLQDRGVSAILSPDGKRLATFGFANERAGGAAPDALPPNRTVQVWDVETGKQLATFVAVTEEFKWIKCAAFSPDGTLLATAADENCVALWEIPAGKPKGPLLGRTTPGVALAFAPDGKTLAAVDKGGTVERWTLPDGKPLEPTRCPLIPGRTDPLHVAWKFQPRGLSFLDNQQVVVWAALRDRIVVWEAPGGKLLTPDTPHPADIAAIRFAANGRDLLSAGGEGRIVRWDPRGGKSTILARCAIESGEQDNPIVLGMADLRGQRGTVVFDPDSGAEAFRLPGMYAFPSPDGSRALAVEWPGAKAETTPGSIWNLETRQEVTSIELPARLSWYGPYDVAVAFGPDHARLVTTVLVPPTRPKRDALIVTGWDGKTGKKLGEFREVRDLEGAELAVADSSKVVLATSDGQLWVADYVKGARGATIAEAPRGTTFTRPTFSPDGTLLAVGVPAEAPGTFAVRIYSWPGRKLLHTFTGHRGPITALAFSPDGKTLASGSVDTTILLWDLTKIAPPKK
jgi:WD40 repeat protein